MVSNFREQQALIDGAIAAASLETIRHALDGTIGDAQSFCWAALRQYERREALEELSTREDFGLHYADLHMLLLIADEAVSHVELLERLPHAARDPNVREAGHSDAERFDRL